MEFIFKNQWQDLKEMNIGSYKAFQDKKGPDLELFPSSRNGD